METVGDLAAARARRGEFKRQLAETAEFQADWRLRKAEEYPHDARNQQSAASLSKLAQRLAALPDNDANLRRLWQILRDEDELLRFVEIEREQLRTYGLHAEEDGDPADYLESLISDIELE